VTGLAHLGVSSPLSYVIAVLLPAFDALIPLLPSETAVIALGVATAGTVDPRAAALVVLAAFGAFLGDNAAYLIGRRFGPAVARRALAGERGARRRAWAERSLNRFGARIIIGCRFIPGGRTAITLTCGLVGYPRRRFVAATAVAGATWASYAFLIGRLGGKAFEDRPWVGLLLALALTAAISVAVEVARRAWAWHRRRRERAARPGRVARRPCWAPALLRAGPAGRRPCWAPALLRAGEPRAGRRPRAAAGAGSHDLHTGCAGPAPRAAWLAASTGLVAAEATHPGTPCRRRIRLPAPAVTRPPGAGSRGLTGPDLSPARVGGARGRRRAAGNVRPRLGAGRFRPFLHG